MKDNHKYLKRFLAFALSVAMVITYMPVNLIAYAETEAPEQPVAEEVVNDTASTEAPAPQEEVKTEEPAPVQEEVTETEPAPVEEPVVTEESSPAEGEQQQAEQPEEVAEETPAEETPEPEEEEAFPAQTFNADKGGVKVLVKAPEGALPEGTEMVVTPANTKAVEQAVKDAVDGEVTGFKAVDITFVKDGEDVEPKVPVQVYLNASGLDADANKSVVHIADNGVAEVDESLCLGCGSCVDACPQGIIRLHEASCTIVVKCSNRDPGKTARTACAVSCIGCGICERNCPSGAAKVEDNLSAIDEELCLSCGMCAVKCPRHAIYDLRGVLTAKR